MDKTDVSAFSTTTTRRQRPDKHSRDRVAGRKRAEKILAELANKSKAFRAAFRRRILAAERKSRWQMPKMECPHCGLRVSRGNLSRHIHACQTRYPTQELFLMSDYQVEGSVRLPRIDRRGEKHTGKAFVELWVTLPDGRQLMGSRYVRVALG